MRDLENRWSRKVAQVAQTGVGRMPEKLRDHHLPSHREVGGRAVAQGLFLGVDFHGRANLMSGKAAKIDHVLDCSRIEDFDELNGDAQLCWVWCRTHGRLEWHSLPRSHAERQDGTWTTAQESVRWS